MSEVKEKFIEESAESIGSAIEKITRENLKQKIVKTLQEKITINGKEYKIFSIENTFGSCQTLSIVYKNNDQSIVNYLNIYTKKMESENE